MPIVHIYSIYDVMAHHRLRSLFLIFHSNFCSSSFLKTKILRDRPMVAAYYFCTCYISSRLSDGPAHKVQILQPQAPPKPLRNSHMILALATPFASHAPTRCSELIAAAYSICFKGCRIYLLSKIVLGKKTQSLRTALEKAAIDAGVYVPFNYQMKRVLQLIFGKFFKVLRCY